MKRREFITTLAGAAVWLFPRMRTAHAQNPAKAGKASVAQIGQVATVQGHATVTRADGPRDTALRVNDPIFRNDLLATGVNSSLGVAFDDETTFDLSANTSIVVNEFVYQEGGKANAASFRIMAGTAAFVASLVAKTGEMKITTPVATMGIRGTTGIIDVPQVGVSGTVTGEPRVKLYADADGAVGQIEVFDLQGGRLGALTAAASAYTLRLVAGARLAVVPFQIPPAEVLRDRLIVQRLFIANAVGRRMTIERLRSRGRRQGNQHPGNQHQGKGRSGNRGDQHHGGNSHGRNNRR